MPVLREAVTTAPNIETKILLQKIDPFNSAFIHNFTRNLKILETEIGSYLVIKRLCSRIFFCDLFFWTKFKTC